MPFAKLTSYILLTSTWAEVVSFQRLSIISSLNSPNKIMSFGKGMHNSTGSSKTIARLVHPSCDTLLHILDCSNIDNTNTLILYSLSQYLPSHLPNIFAHPWVFQHPSSRTLHWKFLYLLPLIAITCSLKSYLGFSSFLSSQLLHPWPSSVGYSNSFMTLQSMQCFRSDFLRNKK